MHAFRPSKLSLFGVSFKRMREGKMFLAATMHFFQRQRIFRELPRVTFSPHGLFRTAAPQARSGARGEAAPGRGGALGGSTREGRGSGHFRKLGKASLL